MAYTGDIDAALVAKLMADTGPGGLMTIMNQGVFFDVAGTYLDAAGAVKRATKFVLVKLMSHAVEARFGGRAVEDPVYLVKAVEQSTGTANTKAAAMRIDALLDGGTLTVNGYTLMKMALEEYVRYAEEDPDDPDIRWQHRGGQYSITVSPNP